MEAKILEFHKKNADSTTVICDKIDGIMVILNLVPPPFVGVMKIFRGFCERRNVSSKDPRTTFTPMGKF